MDMLQWLDEQAQELLIHLEDEYRTENLGVSMELGDCIQVIAGPFKGQRGELQVIDPQEEEGMFGVYLDSLDGLAFFSEDEIMVIDFYGV